MISNVLRLKVPWATVLNYFVYKCPCGVFFFTMYTLSYQSRPQLDRRIFVVVNTRHIQKDQQVAARVVQELWLSLGRSISRARWCEHNSIHKTHVPFGNQTWKLEIHYIYIISVYIYTVYEWRFSICFRSSDDMIDFPATFDDNEGYMQCAPEFDIALVTEGSRA